MAGRMSNRERIERLRAEADAAAKEKEAARAAKAAQPSARKSSSGSSSKSSRSAKTAAKPRVRMAWDVCDSAGKPVKQFPYAQEREAIADAEERTAATGRPHFVTKAEVVVE